MHLYGSLFFSSAALHAVNVCIFVWLCINMCLRTVCMERLSVSLTLTPVFHAKVTLPPNGHISWLRWVMKLTATQSDIETFTLLEDIILYSQRHNQVKHMSF